MGKSYTYHLMGLGPETKNENGTTRKRVYPCMNKRELAQHIEKCKRSGTKLVEVYAQTKTGARSIGAEYDGEEVPIEKVKLPKMVKCPICKGIGNKTPGQDFGYGCPVCEGSGITAPNHWNKWQEWQLERMRKEFI